MIGFQSNVVAGTVLVRSAIQSPNYVAGVSGWTINQDGSVEFNNAVIRGSIIAGGKVRLDSGGVKVDGTIYQYDINFTGGFLARRIPDDGGYAQMNMLVADGLIGGGVFFNPTDPTPNGNTYSSAGAVYSSTAPVGAVDAGYTVIRSPTLTGKTNATLFMYGENSDSTVGPRFSMNGDFGLHGDLSVDGVGHKEYTKFPGPTNVTNSTTPFNITGTTFTIEAGRTYKMHCLAAYNGPTAADARFSWAKTGASVSGDRHIWAPSDSSADNADGPTTAIRRGDATQQIVGTTNGVSNAFSVYEDFIIWTNSGATDEAVQLQFAQGTANATACVLQNGYIFLEMIV